MRVPPLSLEGACDALRQGKLVIYPTETFYGIGCNAMDPDAVGAVFSAKKRSLSLPLPVVVYSLPICLLRMVGKMRGRG